MLAAYAGIIIYSIRAARRERPAGGEAGGKPMSWWLIAVLVAAGLAGLIGSGSLCLDSATAIARRWGVSESVIAITIVATGTSLPELASSLSAVAGGRPSMAVGNIIGSNIFNILFIVGASAAVNPIVTDVAGRDVWMVAGSAVLLLVSAVAIGVRRITRAEGAVYLAVYVGYVIWLLN